MSGERNRFSIELQTSFECAQVFLASVEVIKFHTTDAYTNLGLTGEKYKINKLSKVENEKVILRIRPKTLID
jgi:hypothetical protein